MRRGSNHFCTSHARNPGIGLQEINPRWADERGEFGGDARRCVPLDVPRHAMEPLHRVLQHAAAFFPTMHTLPQNAHCRFFDPMWCANAHRRAGQCKTLVRKTSDCRWAAACGGRAAGKFLRSLLAAIPGRNALLQDAVGTHFASKECATEKGRPCRVAVGESGREFPSQFWRKPRETSYRGER